MIKHELMDTTFYMKIYKNTGHNKVSYVMRVSAANRATARCCNTANSSLTIDGKFEIMNNRIGSVWF